MITKRTKTNQNAALLQFIINRGVKRNFIAKKIGISYGRLIVILRGAPTYTHEAVKLSQTLDAPLDSLFPHLFHNQNTPTKSNSHE